jgi:hypothetical protein
MLSTDAGFFTEYFLFEVGQLLKFRGKLRHGTVKKE